MGRRDRKEAVASASSNATTRLPRGHTHQNPVRKVLKDLKRAARFLDSRGLFVSTFFKGGRNGDL